TLAHADGAEEKAVPALHRRAPVVPAAMAPAVGDEVDEPVAGGADRHPHEHAPDQERPAAQHEEQQRQRGLLPAPGALEEAEKWIAPERLVEARPDGDRGLEPAVQVPEVVA